MSRSGYTDDIEDGALGLWRGAVNRALQGKRGQNLLRELAQALDAMPEKRLYPNSFATAEGEFCTLGVLGAKRGLALDDLGDDEDCDPAEVARRFGIAPAMAAEIMYLNDEYAVDIYTWEDIEVCGPIRPYYPEFGQHRRSVRVPNDKHPIKRWQYMRHWVTEQIKTEGVAA